MRNQLESGIRAAGSGQLCRRPPEALSERFGVHESNDCYADTAEHALTVIARVDEREVGLLTLIKHTPGGRTRAVPVRNTERKLATVRFVDVQRSMDLIAAIDLRSGGPSSPAYSS